MKNMLITLFCLSTFFTAMSMHQPNYHNPSPKPTIVTISEESDRHLDRNGKDKKQTFIQKNYSRCKTHCCTDINCICAICWIEYLAILLAYPEAVQFGIYLTTGIDVTDPKFNLQPQKMA